MKSVIFFKELLRQLSESGDGESGGAGTPCHGKHARTLPRTFSEWNDLCDVRDDMKTAYVCWSAATTLLQAATIASLYGNI